MDLAMAWHALQAPRTTHHGAACQNLHEHALVLLQYSCSEGASSPATPQALPAAQPPAQQSAARMPTAPP